MVLKEVKLHFTIELTFVLNTWEIIVYTTTEINKFLSLLVEIKARTYILIYYFNNK